MLRVSTEDATELLRLCGNLHHDDEGKRKRVKRSIMKWLHSFLIVKGKLIHFLKNYIFFSVSHKAKDTSFYLFLCM